MRLVFLFIRRVCHNAYPPTSRDTFALKYIREQPVCPGLGEIASTAVAAASELLRLVHHFAAKNCFEDAHVFESILWHREDIIGEYGHVGILARLD